MRALGELAHGDAGAVRQALAFLVGELDTLEARDMAETVVQRNPAKLRRAFRGRDVIARHVSAIIYVHAEDGGLYVHGFGHEPTMQQRGGVLALSNLSKDSNVQAFGQPDGSVRLAHSGGLTLWGDY